MKGKITLTCGYIMVLWFMFTMHIQELKKANHQIYIVNESAFQAFELDHYDDRAFPIAQLLEHRNISSDARELLDLSQLILDKSEEIGVNPSLILAMIDVESTFEPCARSHVGAKGLMQVMPHRILGYRRTKEEFAFNYHVFYEPFWNIEFGVNYLGSLLKRFGNVEKALSAYNQGPTRFASEVRQSGYATSRYAKQVLKRVKRYEIGI